MAKTRRTKINRSPGKPYRNSKTYVAIQGEKVTTIGFRGRTKVLRIDGRAVRHVEEVPQTPAKAVGDRKPKGIFVGRQYTGVARSKLYPVRGAKRGGPAIAPGGNMIARAARAVKRVVVRDAAE